MESYGKFDLNGYHFERFLPSDSKEEQVWTIIVTKNNNEIHRETIPLTYEPTFGPDIGDVAACDDRVEEIIKELKAE